LRKVKYCYAGISGCQGDPRYNSQLENLLKKWVSNCKTEGDLYSSFRSLSENETGMLAISGSGTAVVSFLEDRTEIFSGIGVGGKDYAYGVEYLLMKGTIKPDSKVGRTILKDIKLEEIESKFHGRVGLNNEILNSITQILAEASKKDQGLTKELETLSDLFIARWLYKITGHIYKFNFNEKKSFDLVLSGSMWKWDQLRNEVIQNLGKSAPNANVIYDPLVKPVEGCVKIAVKENSK